MQVIRKRHRADAFHHGNDTGRNGEDDENRDGREETHARHKFARPR